MNGILQKCVYVDPSSTAYYEDRLFDSTNLILNRDDTLAPFIRLRATLDQQGVILHTADLLPQQLNLDHPSDYYSLGVLENFTRLSKRGDIQLRAFVIFEPPVVDPRLYRALPELTASFERVYVHNVEGDGYSLRGVNQSRLRKLFWPQPQKDVMSAFWGNEDRLKRLVMINGNHKPISYGGELYSKRIEALAALSVYGKVDLYGRGWERWWSRNSLWMPYWRNRRTLMSIYKGACSSKYEVLSQYEFSLCFENMSMKGYVTEKIFDCLYAGTIPVYLGASDISNIIPADVYIDCRNFSSWHEMQTNIMALTNKDIKSYRVAGKKFIQSSLGLKYYSSLISIFQE